MGLLAWLIAQASNPRGMVGDAMLRIMNRAHAPLDKTPAELRALLEATGFSRASLDETRSHVCAIAVK